MPKNVNGRTSGRPRGRPRLTIDRDAVADAVAELFHAGGYEAVSIVDTAEKLSVSRATLYRTVPTKQDLLGILFERSTREITERVEAAIRDIADPAERLREVVRLQSEAAVQMRSYMPVFFDGGDLPNDVVQRWHKWSRQFEKLWVSVVAANMEAGNIEKGDLVITTRLILGMILWVSRWYRPKEKISADEIAEHAIGLLRLGYVPAEGGNRKSGAPRRRRTTAR
ncbi:TetR/AcrR family transcriptional regulator [Mycobacterium sp. Aquia_216]|uniref:TetR/AcrR family transcriptional regulator n=1 Tax=Mycobacterium sp. Aquia_216 TaxID=2991729 RepID=UPI00227C9561|nr:TetR/AcrR family transcriptional regulator [Mycobacterium sp. Aquia_216]WAJ43487.1 TetR/AcrR family transcriptional regulator [Mycobacterium sp. Aquia_216]